MSGTHDYEEDYAPDLFAPSRRSGRSSINSYKKKMPEDSSDHPDEKHSHKKEEGAKYTSEVTDPTLHHAEANLVV